MPASAPGGLALPWPEEVSRVGDVMAAAESLRRLLRDVDVGMLSGESCASLAAELARVEKACAAVRAMAAARAADCGEHRRRGFAQAEEWAARLTGSTRQQARNDLTTGARLVDCPTTKDAAVDGALSLGQADEITRTEREKPGSEDVLVGAAKGGASRQQLAERCRKRRQEGVDRDALAPKQRGLRSLRSWTDGEGMVCGQFRLEPTVGVPLLARLEVAADRLHRAARKNGSDERWQAHAADALVAMLGDGGKSTKPHKHKADVVFVVDLRTFRQGVHDDTVCHIVGNGPVSPEVVREMARDAFLKVVFHDGVNIHTVTHVGRYIPAELRTALELGDLPDLDGTVCSGCGKRFRLEWDHVEPVVAGGVTSFANEDPKCWECHGRKCDEERAAGLYRRVPAGAGVESQPP